MSIAQTAATDPAPNEGCTHCRDAAAERAAWRLRLLEELAEIEMRRLRSLARQASAEAAAAEDPAVEPAGAPAQGSDLAHARVARSLRQTLALHAKLDEDRESQEKRRAAEAATAAERERRGRRKRVVKRVVEQVIALEATDQFHAEDLLADLYKRLEDPDDSAFGDRPIPLIIAGIAKDLPIFFPRHHWADDIKAIMAEFGVEDAEEMLTEAVVLAEAAARASADQGTASSSPCPTAEESVPSPAALGVPTSEDSG
jgi:hypothetical protein